MLTVSVANGTELSVTAVKTVGTNMDLDFSGTITDAEGVAYTIVSLTGFAGKPITSLVFPTGLRATGHSAFRGCTSLQTVTPLLPETLTQFGQRTFEGCTSLEGDVVFPAHEVTSPYSWADGTWGWFRGSKITSCDMSQATMSTIVATAFSGCTSLKWVKLPKGLATIEREAFVGATALEKIEPLLPDTLTTLGPCPFRGCSSLTGDVKLTNASAVVTFTHHNNNGYGTFQGCAKITSFEMTAGIAYNNGGVGVVGQSMFKGCSSLGSVVLPANVTKMGFSSVFNGCSSLTNVTFLGWQTPTSFHKNSFDGVPNNKVRVFYPRLSPTWEAFQTTLTGYKTWDEATDAQRKSYTDLYPNDTVQPLGLFKLNTQTVWISDLKTEDARSVYVLGAPVEVDDEETPVTPTYGGYHDLANGTTLTLTAPDVAVYDGGEYRCAGYELSYETDTRIWSDPVTNAATTCTIDAADDKVWRLRWLWEPNGYALDATPMNAGGSVTCEPANSGLYAPDTVVTVTAVANAAAGYSFVCWSGDDAPTDDAARDPVATVTMDAAKELRPVFAADHWTYDGSKTLSNGNWSLTVTRSGTELSVTAATAIYGGGVLDFGQPITDVNGTAYTIVSLTGFSGNPIAGLVLPTGLRTLGRDAFLQCTLLKTVEPFLPETLTAIGQQAFAGCTALEGDVVFPAQTVTTSGSGGNCGWFQKTKITSCDMSQATMTEIIYSAFNACAQLKWVKLPKGVKAIGNNAFFETPALETIDPFFPDTVTSVGRGVLYGNKVLSQPLVLRGQADISTARNNNYGWDGVFSGTKIPSADLSGGIVNLANGCFYNASSLGSIVLGPKLTTLDSQSLWAASLTNVVFLGDAPTSIESTTFPQYSAYKIVVTLPLAKPGWAAYAEQNFTVPTADEKATYRQKYPNGPALRAIWPRPNNTKLFVCSSSSAGLLLIVR